mmetsp:Transcript_16167/g.24385  ORF Transcript_16167/g.24385 Transcript_16167/m.24385 type:complete len:136 (-) Transcript_16167:48-455(-)
MGFITLFVYFHGIFEIAVGAVMVMAPELLHDGTKPEPGFASYGLESFGIGCCFWGLVLLCKAKDKAICAFDTLYNIIWAVYLLRHVQGGSWQAHTAIPTKNGDWAMVPFGFHCVFTVTSAIAYVLAPSSKKSKTE